MKTARFERCQLFFADLTGVKKTTPVLLFYKIYDIFCCLGRILWIFRHNLSVVILFLMKIRGKNNKKWLTLQYLTFFLEMSFFQEILSSRYRSSPFGYDFMYIYEKS